MNEVISICIPTRNRLDLLKQAIETCFQQSYRPLEILIGDDSDGAECEVYFRNLASPAGVTIRYKRNTSPPGQARNVNSLFDDSQGSRLLLLHDDDLLCSSGLDDLAEAWRQNPGARCVYGSQLVISNEGEVLHDRSELWNDHYFRLTRMAGRQASPVRAALQQQVPNNCFLIESALARATRYRLEHEVGQSVDAEFVVRLSQSCEPDTFVLIDRPVSKYRLTPSSIARSKDLNRREDLFFETIEKIEVSGAEREAKQLLLSRLAVGASLDAAMAGRRVLAIRIIFSRSYKKPMLSRWTAYRLLCVLFPRTSVRIKRAIEGRRRRDLAGV